MVIQAVVDEGDGESLSIWLPVAHKNVTFDQMKKIISQTAWDTPTFSWPPSSE